MDRVNGADFIDIGGGKRGFRDESLDAGVVGTEVTAVWLNDLQENLAAVIESAGLALAAGDWTLLYRAIQRIAASQGLANIPVDGAVSSAPGAPSEGAQYLIATGSTGIWAGKDGQIARWRSGAWIYETVRSGRMVSYWTGTRLVMMRHNGAAWAEWLASDTAAGPVELATAAETQAGTDATRAVTPAGLGASKAAEGGRTFNFKLVRSTGRAVVTGPLNPGLVLWSGSYTKLKSGTLLVFRAAPSLRLASVSSTTYARGRILGSPQLDLIQNHYLVSNNDGGNYQAPQMVEFVWDGIPAGNLTLEFRVGQALTETGTVVVNPSSADNVGQPSNGQGWVDGYISSFTIYEMEIQP